MLIGYQFERTARDDLHIHSINWVQSGFVLLASAMALIFPGAAVLAIMETGSSPAGMDPLSSLLLVLGLLLIPALGLALLVYTGTRETLLLSRLDGEGKRRTQNFSDAVSGCIRCSGSTPPNTSNCAATRRPSQPPLNCGW